MSSKRKLSSSINTKKPTLKTCLIFQETELSSSKLKKQNLLHFRRELPKPEQDKFLFLFLCFERTFQVHAQKKKVAHSFFYKRAKFFEIFSYSLINRFFWFYYIVSYTWRFFYYLLTDFCNVHDFFPFLL